MSYISTADLLRKAYTLFSAFTLTFFLFPFVCVCVFSSLLWNYVTGIYMSNSDFSQPSHFSTQELFLSVSSAWASFQACYLTSLVLPSKWWYQVTGELGRVAEPAPPVCPMYCYLYLGEKKSDKIDHISSYFV